jgi:hypothetical protein
MDIEDQILFAKVAYAAYGKTTGGEDYQGHRLPEWEALTPTIRSAWINAATAVREHITVTFNLFDALRGTADPVVRYRHGE